MTPLLIVLLGLGAVYLGAIEAAFGALVRLSLRLVAERPGRSGPLGEYLDDPPVLFVPVRALLGVVTASATALVAREIGIDSPQRVALVILSVVGFLCVCELLLPLVIVGSDPERVLRVLLPSFGPIARALKPLTRRLTRDAAGQKRETPPAEGVDGTSEAPRPEATASEEVSVGEEQQLLRSLVEFKDTLVREVMTPRPDIVAIREDTTVGELRALFLEQEYSRFPVFKDSLDNIVGFVFVKDLVPLGANEESRAVASLLRPAVFVPESKRVPELLKQFQRQQTQCAIVVDEYGGTAGLVTIEDLLEEIVGEIRDEYDVETEPIVQEGEGRYIVSGKVGVDELAERLEVRIEREGFETMGGYLLSRLGRVPAVGERFDIDGLSVEVLDAERRRINRVRIIRQAVSATDTSTPESAT